MIKETITYTTYDNEEVTEDHYFNLSRAELAEWNFSANGGLAEKLTAIVKAKDTAEIYKYFKELLKKSYGVKSDDGKQFIKSEEIWTKFEQSEAYSELVVKLLGNEEYAMKFVNGLANIKDLEKAIEQKSQTNN